MSANAGHGYDVAIIGAGDVGAAIARELARFELRVVLLDAGDVGAGTSKANTAILHTGYDAKPGTRKAELVARGHGLLLAYAEEAGIPLERTGALLVAWTGEQLDRFPAIEDNARRNGYHRTAPVAVDELYRREPHLGPGALGALEVPGEYIVCPWTPPLACATQAVLAGVDCVASPGSRACAGSAAGTGGSTRARARLRRELIWPRIEITQAGRRLWFGRLPRVMPGRSAALRTQSMTAVDPAAGPVTVRVLRAREPHGTR